MLAEKNETPKAAVLLARANWNTRIQQRLTAETALYQARNALANVIGYDLDDINSLPIPRNRFPQLDKKLLQHYSNLKFFVRIAYFARNDSSKVMTVQAIPSVTPSLAASHLKKTECFCFNQQTLKAHQSMDMPIIFHLDNDLPKNIKEITLSYTLFKFKGS